MYVALLPALYGTLPSFCNVENALKKLSMPAHPIANEFFARKRGAHLWLFGRSHPEYGHEGRA